MSIVAEDEVRRYLNLPYRIAVTREAGDEELPWRATVEELPGCDVRGATPADATARIPAALAEWVASAQADGREVPEPRDARSYSGRLLLRMSRTLHSELAHAAERDQISLNAYINYLLAGALRQHPPAPAREAAADEREADEPLAAGSTARLQRFLAVALAANVAVATVVATVAVILLITAT
jgi:antitoxin HicB